MDYQEQILLDNLLNTIFLLQNQVFLNQIFDLILFEQDILMDNKLTNIDIEFSLSTALIADSLFLCGSHSAYYVCIIEVAIYDAV